MADEVRHLEELAANAWPAAVVQVVDGWRLRYTYGVTRRANSVWPNEHGGECELMEKLALVEDFYRRRRARPRFQMSPAARPSKLDRVLGERGYKADARTLVQTAALATVLERGSAAEGEAVTIADEADDAWFAAYCEAEVVRPADADVRRGILERIGPRAAYAAVTVDGRIASQGLAVLERGWVGIFSMSTHPEMRRRGLARAVMHGLARWGQEAEATGMYLQVMAGNVEALGLYRGLGFATRYEYWYREGGSEA